MQLSVIITTYNSPDWLQKVIWGYETQLFKDFELVIADDGSGAATTDLVQAVQTTASFPVQHIWQEDEGFRKCTVLNKAIKAARAEYLVISDGDCIPRNDFLRMHDAFKRPEHFLSGGYSKLTAALSAGITKDDIYAQRCFNVNWLKQQGLPSSFKNIKFTSPTLLSFLLNKITPTNASWNGHNSSAFKQDILNVNGFDERMKYGALDREMGERLENNGIKGLQIRYSAVCVHLDHARGYKNAVDLAGNKAIWEKTKKEKLKWTDYGIIKSTKPSV